MPIGMSRISAISLYENPSTSASRTGDPELLGEVLERRLHLVVGEALDQLVLGAAAGHRRLEAAEPPVHVEVLDVVEVGLVRAAAAWPGRC